MDNNQQLSNIIVDKQEQKTQLNKSNQPIGIKYLIYGFLIFFIICLFLYGFIYIYGEKKHEGFNNNVLEQQMYQEMTKENKQIYLELTNDAKQNMFESWKKMKSL